MPKTTQSAITQIRDLLQKNELVEAARTLDKQLSAHPNIGDLWALASEVALRRGDSPRAWAAIQRASEIDGNDPRRHVQRARCAVLADKVDEAISAVDDSVEHGVSSTTDLLTLASVLVHCNEHERALKFYQRVENLDAVNFHMWRGVASVHRFLGDIPSAEHACDEALRLNAHDYETQHLRSTLRRQTTDNNHVAELSSLLDSGIRDWRGRVQVEYALAKELEDLEQFEDSFEHLQKGATLRRQNLKYDATNDLDIFPRLQETFSKKAIERCAATQSGDPSDAPIFVLGLPRSGSTLVERIISSHSAVSTAGELNDFAIELVALAKNKNNGTPPPRLDLPPIALSVDMADLGSNYLRAAQSKAADTRHFVDKLPLNSLYVGLIHLALPNARIVHVHRNPMDACYAMYKFHFKNGYPFSYDLRELGNYYAAHSRLMQHWHNVLPAGSLFDLRYEDLVDSQESVSRKLLEFLDLDWEPACLDFHRNTRASTTGSASQVRQPIYRSSVNKWRHFESQLQTLLDTLTEYNIALE